MNLTSLFITPLHSEGQQLWNYKRKSSETTSIIDNIKTMLELIRENLTRQNVQHIRIDLRGQRLSNTEKLWYLQSKHAFLNACIEILNKLLVGLQYPKFSFGTASILAPGLEKFQGAFGTTTDGVSIKPATVRKRSPLLTLDAGIQGVFGKRCLALTDFSRLLPIANAPWL